MNPKQSAYPREIAAINGFFEFEESIIPLQQLVFFTIQTDSFNAQR